jgi:hypothetical protein
VIDEEVGLSCRSRGHQRFEFISSRPVQRPHWYAGRVRIASLRELRPVTDHRVLELLLVERQRRRNSKHIEQVLNLRGMIGAERKACSSGSIEVQRGILIVELIGIRRHISR